MDAFLALWAEAALTTLGFFWMAFWAFCLGYLISSMIQVFVTEKRMQRTMGESGVRSVALGTFFGFISALALRGRAGSGHGGERSWMDTVLLGLAGSSLAWLGGGVVLSFLG